MYINNPLGCDIDESDMGEIQEKLEAERIGRRIRKIRESKEPKMTMTDLGAAVGLNANRIQQYENGARRPRFDLLKEIAAALGVETLALLDPVPESDIGVMYTLFDLESSYDLQVEEQNGKIVFYFGDSHIHRDVKENLKAWHERRKERDSALQAAGDVEEQEAINRAYNEWEWTFPKALAERREKDLKEVRKKKLEDTIKDLQQQLSDLKNDEE